VSPEGGRRPEAAGAGHRPAAAPGDRPPPAARPPSPTDGLRPAPGGSAPAIPRDCPRVRESLAPNATRSRSEG